MAVKSEQIISETAKASGVTVEQILGSDRTPDVLTARPWLAWRLPSLPRRLLGARRLQLLAGVRRRCDRWGGRKHNHRQEPDCRCTATCGCSAAGRCATAGGRPTASHSAADSRSTTRRPTPAGLG